MSIPLHITGAEIKQLAREMDRLFRLQVIDVPPRPAADAPEPRPRWWLV